MVGGEGRQNLVWGQLVNRVGDKLLVMKTR